jgi:hypothetical protein
MRGCGCVGERETHSGARSSWRTRSFAALAKSPPPPHLRNSSTAFSLRFVADQFDSLNPFLPPSLPPLTTPLLTAFSPPDHRTTFDLPASDMSKKEGRGRGLMEGRVGEGTRHGQREDSERGSLRMERAPGGGRLAVSQRPRAIIPEATRTCRRRDSDAMSRDSE